MKTYTLITPVKNEEKIILKVIESIKNQSLRPSLWIIVNDGSTDRTNKILNEKIKEKWINVINKKINAYYDWLGYSKVINEGLRLLLKSSEYKESEFVGILDADISVEKSYFEKLIKTFNRFSKLGVVSGKLFVKRNGKLVPENEEDSPWGGARVYSKRALEEIGGFPQTPSPDRVSDIKLANRGYKLYRLNSAKAIQYRETFARDGRLKGIFLNGRSRYVLRYNPLHMFLISIQIGVKTRPYLLSGGALLLGYISGFVVGAKRVEDTEIREYSRNFWKRLYAKK